MRTVSAGQRLTRPAVFLNDLLEPLAMFLVHFVHLAGRFKKSLYHGRIADRPAAPERNAFLAQLLDDAVADFHVLLLHGQQFFADGWFLECGSPVLPFLVLILPMSN